MSAPIRIHIAKDRIARAQVLDSLKGGSERSALDIATEWGLDTASEARLVLEQLDREGVVRRVQRDLDTAYALVGTTPHQRVLAAQLQGLRDVAERLDQVWSASQAEAGAGPMWAAHLAICDARIAAHKAVQAAEKATASEVLP